MTNLHKYRRYNYVYYKYVQIRLKNFKYLSYSKKRNNTFKTTWQYTKYALNFKIDKLIDIDILYRSCSNVWVLYKKKLFDDIQTDRFSLYN